MALTSLHQLLVCLHNVVFAMAYETKISARSHKLHGGISNACRGKDASHLQIIRRNQILVADSLAQYIRDPQLGE